jgi:hypothetical protein
MAKKLYRPVTTVTTQGESTQWQVYDESTGQWVNTTAPDNADLNSNSSTLVFNYSVAGDCFKRVVTECLECNDGVWNSEVCYDEAGNVVTCPDFTNLGAYDVGCPAASVSTTAYDTTTTPVCFDDGVDVYKGFLVKVFTDGVQTSQYVEDLEGNTYNTYTLHNCPCAEEALLVPFASNYTNVNVVTSVARDVDLSIQSRFCPNGQTTTFQLVGGSNINCSVTILGNIATITGTATGSYEFDYRIYCNGVASAEIGKVSGNVL